MERDNRPSPKRRVGWRAVLTIVAVLIAIFLYYTISSLFLHVETVSVQAAVVSPIRIVHLSDLHNSHFGKENKTLIQTISLQEPDLIIMSGDMLNRDDENTRIVTSLISNLTPIAPVYYGYGNHEKNWEERFHRDLRPILEAAGAIVVDVDFVDLSIQGTDCRIGGYMGYYPVPHMTTGDKDQQGRESAFRKDFEDTDRLKILINHIPTAWVDWDYVDRYDVDLVFSGHYHGGTIRIPILDQGLYAPYVGWFPPFTKGVYSGSLATCVLSAGLGNEHHIPRFNNPPEIVVVDLIPNEAKRF